MAHGAFMVVFQGVRQLALCFSFNREIFEGFAFVAVPVGGEANALLCKVQ